MSTQTTAHFGSTGVPVSRIGLGCMGMSGIYGASSDEESIGTIHRAFELGCTFIDTADVYGAGHNEELVGKALKGHRDKTFLATKFGLSGLSNSPGQLSVNGSPEYVRAACDASLKRLGVDVIDLYYLHRLDQSVPIEDTVGAMAELVKEGKVRFLGLSEISANTLRKAHDVHPISAVQSEYSLWWTAPEKEVLPACRELGIAFVPYSPLGRGMLTGKISSADQFEEKDWRRVGPRFQGDALSQNLTLVEAVSAIARSKGVTAGQIALAWLLSEGLDIFPIPGTKRIAYLEENWSSLKVELSDSERSALRRIVEETPVTGDRYPEHAGRLVEP